mmetsp:Transcript_28735/g.77835  ORF Transcript_28735/g.77835 Transcript_28735/m.77835 type:complete len:205 (+) Transcript_28735:633-1247(+)
MIVTVERGEPEPVPTASIALTTSSPSTTFPKTTCLPSNQGVLTVVIKNWDPLVLGPALAILRYMGPSCLRLKFSSSNLAPKMLSPPVPFPLVKSPPWIMKLGMMRWKVLPLKCRGFLDPPTPFSPVQRARKFSVVLGTSSVKRPMTIRPACLSPIEISKNTFLPIFWPVTAAKRVRRRVAASFMVKRLYKCSGDVLKCYGTFVL